MLLTLTGSCNLKISNCAEETELTIESDGCLDITARKSYKCIHSFIEDDYEVNIDNICHTIRRKK